MAVHYDVWGNITAKEGWGGDNPAFTENALWQIMIGVFKLVVKVNLHNTISIMETSLPLSESSTIIPLWVCTKTAQQYGANSHRLLLVDTRQHVNN